MFESIKLYKNQTQQKDALLKELRKQGYDITDFISQEGDFAHRGGVVDVFPAGFEQPVRIEFSDNKISSIYSFNLTTSEMSSVHQMVIVLPRIPTHGHSKKSFFHDMGEGVPIDNFVDIMPGDMVVHIDHGIGIYQGIRKVKEAGDKINDYLLIEYADKDKLYVPAEEIGFIQKYIRFY